MLCFHFSRSTAPLSYLMLGGNLRVFGPAQQPIALGAALILILPLAVYFARTCGRRWWLVALTDPPRRLGQWLTHGHRDACCRGHRFLAAQAKRDEEALASSHSRDRRRPFRIARNDRRTEGRLFPQRRADRPAIEIRSRLQPPACRRAYPSDQADAERGQREAVVRRGLRDENQRLRRARPKRSDPRRSMAEQRARRRLRRPRGMDLADGESRS